MRAERRKGEGLRTAEISPRSPSRPQAERDHGGRSTDSSSPLGLLPTIAQTFQTQFKDTAIVIREWCVHRPKSQVYSLPTCAGGRLPRVGPGRPAPNTLVSSSSCISPRRTDQTHLYCNHAPSVPVPSSPPPRLGGNIQAAHAADSAVTANATGTRTMAGNVRPKTVNWRIVVEFVSGGVL